MKGLGEKLKGGFGKLGKRTRILLGVVLAAIVVGALAVALLLNNQPYSVLFTGLSGDEARSIMSFLDENGAADYRLQGSGTILVPRSQESQLKAKLLMEGYPKSGFAYDTYRSAVGTMSTEADRNMAYLQDLQDRMAGVIRCLDGVKDAVVTIAQGEDRRYVLNDDNVIDATASVLVTMRSGAALSAQQVAAIRSLVSHAVKGLAISDVAVSDSNGNVYGAEDAAAGLSDASQLKLQLEEQINNKTRTQIMAVLTPLFGADNVSVGVTSTVDVSRSVGESTTYTAPDGAEAGQGILGSTVYKDIVARPGGDAAGGVAGTAGNADIPTYVDSALEPTGDETYAESSGEKGYMVNSNKEQVERIAGTVTDLSVAVTINRAAAGGISQGDLIGHVARAAGITTQQQGEKISILISDFYTAPAPGVLPDVPGLPAWSLYAAAGGLALLVLVLLIIGLTGRRRKRRRALAAQEAMTSLMSRMPAAEEEIPQGADIMNIRTEKSLELRRDIRQFAESNPELAAQMVKGWLRGGEEQNG